MIYPKHIALIPDWNRTRAKEKWFHQMIWHMEWSKTVTAIIKYLFTNTEVEVFTVWGLSTENMGNRTPEELEYLFDLYKTFNEGLFEFMQQNQINFKRVWSSAWLPQHLIDFLLEKMRKLKFDNNKYVILAINYGGRDELIRWINKRVDETWWNKSIDENTLSSYLDFAEFPPIELVIRTKWELAKRLSGFMLWWIGYAQLYFTATKCPDFREEELKKALERFDSIADKRNFGK